MLFVITRNLIFLSLILEEVKDLLTAELNNSDTPEVAASDEIEDSGSNQTCVTQTKELGESITNNNNKFICYLVILNI